MAEQRNLEERFTLLESRVLGLERQREIQEDRDIALLARIDSFIDDLHRIERVQMRGFEDLKIGQKNLEARQDHLERGLIDVVDTLKNHKMSIETLAEQITGLVAGQQQILSLLIGNIPRND